MFHTASLSCDYIEWGYEAHQDSDHEWAAHMAHCSSVAASIAEDIGAAFGSSRISMWDGLPTGMPSSSDQRSVLDVDTDDIPF